MGKAADNEKKKLCATFYNNIGVGMIVGGFLVPYLSIFGKLGSIISNLSAGHWPDFEGRANAIAVAVAMIVAFVCGMHMRNMSDRVASTIED